MFNFQPIALENFILCGEHKGENSETNIAKKKNPS